MEISQAALSNYQLIDSGNGKKLERLGQYKLIRPAGICVWKPRRDQSIWDSADAEYDPKKGWHGKLKLSETWKVRIAALNLELRLQSNGQIGLFPEHALALNTIDMLCRASRIPSQLSALNLFAYTGMATCYCAQRGVNVTHVDLSKKTLEWANGNLKLNSISGEGVRLICEDAIKFIEREVRRGRKYNAVIVDPPSFSRVSKTKHWKLMDHLGELASNCIRLLDSDSGQFLLIFSCHDPLISAQILGNVLGDFAPKGAKITAEETGLPEADSSRTMPAGCVAVVSSLNRH